MPVPATRTRTELYLDGQQHLATDPILEAEAARNLVGRAVSHILGVDTSVSAYTPLPFSVSGMVVTIGGVTNKQAHVQNRLVDYLDTSVPVTVAASAGSDRYDLISVQYAQNSTTDSFARNLISVGGVISPGTVFYTYESATFRIDTGTPGAGVPPATPGGWTALYQVRVPASAGSINASNITVLAPTVGQALNAVKGSAALGTPGSAYWDAGIAVATRRVYDSGHSITYDTIQHPSLPCGRFREVNAGLADYAAGGTVNLDLLFSLRVKKGAGAQTIGGRCGVVVGANPAIPSGGAGSASPAVTGASTIGAVIGGTVGNTSFQLDGSSTGFLYGGISVATGASPAYYLLSNYFTWSTTIPDDGVAHTLMVRTTGTSITTIEITPFLPLTVGGAFDSTKFDIIAPG